MKTLIIILLLIVPAISQAQCEQDWFSTLGILYTYDYKAGGIGAEYGLTGDKRPITAQVGLVIFNRSERIVDDKKMLMDSAITTRIYTKFGIRLFRKDFGISIFTGGLINMDLDYGAYLGAFTKFLVPVGDKTAISVEPSYLAYRGINLQMGIHLKL